jgi:hypothetical protein
LWIEHQIQQLVLCPIGSSSSEALAEALIIRLIIQTIRRDRSGSDGIDEAPNLSRPDPTGADQIDAEHQATDLAVSRASWQVPYIGVPFRSDMAAGWWTILLPAVQRGRCRGCPQCRGGRAPGVRQAASGVRASGQPFSAGCVDLAS